MKIGAENAEEEHTDTAAELRAAIARKRTPAYKVAAEADLHPVTLSRTLHGHLPLPAELAQRIRGAIERVAQREARRGR